VGDDTGLAEARLGLGFEVSETPEEVCMRVETTVDIAGCPAVACGRSPRSARAEIRDLRCFGRPDHLIWLKRRWQFRDRDREERTWIEGAPHVPARAVPTERARRRGNPPGR
jgi:hypothetical protein